MWVPCGRVVVLVLVVLRCLVQRSEVESESNEASSLTANSGLGRRLPSHSSLCFAGLSDCSTRFS